MYTHAPRLRCHECGSKDICGVCVRCAAPGCAKHAQPLEHRSLEYDGLNLGDHEGQQPVHCGNAACKRYTRVDDYRLLAGCIAALVIGGGLSFVQGPSVFNVSVAIVGLLACGAWLLDRQQRWRSVREEPPVLPLPLHLSSVTVLERLEGEIKLDSVGNYSIARGVPTGAVQVDAQLNNASQDALEAYGKKFGAPGPETRICAGYLVPVGELNATFESVENIGTRAISMLGSVSSDGSPTTDKGPTRASWRPHLKYEIQRKMNAPDFPVRVVAALVQGSAKRSMQVEVQWNSLKRDRSSDAASQPQVRQISLLEMHFPATWGEARVKGELAESGASGPMLGDVPSRVVRIRTLNLAEDDRCLYCKRFVVTFERDIDVDSHVTGRVEVEFASMLSGLRTFAVYSPLGNLRERVRVEASSLVVASFELHLGNLRWQQMRSHPDEAQRKQGAVFRNLRPDHVTAWTLADRLSSHFFVKSVFESQAGTTTNQNEVGRRWNITGRCYNGVCPIDFELLLDGTHLATSGSLNSSTSVTGSVQGVYANSDMERAVRETWHRLEYQVKATLNALRGNPE